MLVAPETLAIVNRLDSELAKRSRVSLPMKAGSETQIASKSFVCSVAVLNLLAAELTGPSMPDRLASLQAVAQGAETYLAKVAKGEGKLPDSIAACTHMDIVASGASFSTAYKSALVAREVPRIFASAIDCADYAHGWAKAIGPGYLGVVLAPEYRAGTIEERAVRQILDRGGEGVFDHRQFGATGRPPGGPSTSRRAGLGGAAAAGCDPRHHDRRHGDRVTFLHLERYWYRAVACPKARRPP